MGCAARLFWVVPQFAKREKRVFALYFIIALSENAKNTLMPHAINNPVAARCHFPRGLAQPAGTFRFSADALLLACFLRPGKAFRVLDLGSGCGVVGLAMLCRSPEITVTGIDCLAESVAAAARNARQLGFAGRCAFLHADLDSPRLFAPGAEHKYATDILRKSPDNPALSAESFDLAVANPPYRQRDCGRLPQSPARLTALFEGPTTRAAFCRAAATALKPGGRFAVIYPAAREAALNADLARHGLFAARILPLAPKPGREPVLLLVESVKTEAPGECLREDPLVLHSEHGGHTPEALAYCPFLGSASI